MSRETAIIIGGMVALLVGVFIVGIVIVQMKEPAAIPGANDPIRNLPNPDATLLHDLLQPDPIISALEEQAERLDQCAAKHGDSDYTSMAAYIRATLAMTSNYPDASEKDILTFQMENANAALAHC